MIEFAFDLGFHKDSYFSQVIILCNYSVYDAFQCQKVLLEIKNLTLSWMFIAEFLH